MLAKSIHPEVVNPAPHGLMLIPIVKALVICAVMEMGILDPGATKPRAQIMSIVISLLVMMVRACTLYSL